MRGLQERGAVATLTGHAQPDGPGPEGALPDEGGVAQGGRGERGAGEAATPADPGLVPGPVAAGAHESEVMGDGRSPTGPARPAVTSHPRSGPPPGATRRFAVAGGVAALVVLADQLTKWWALDRLSQGPVHVVGSLDFELVRNPGSAFSLFEGSTAALAVVAGALVVALVLFVRYSHSMLRAAVLGLVIGGALGNLADRLFRGDHGAVVDFINLHFWPTFNVADSCIVVGCIGLAISVVRGAKAP